MILSSLASPTFLLREIEMLIVQRSTPQLSDYKRIIVADIFACVGDFGFRAKPSPFRAPIEQPYCYGTRTLLELCRVPLCTNPIDITIIMVNFLRLHEGFSFFGPSVVDFSKSEIASQISLL